MRIPHLPFSPHHPPLRRLIPVLSLALILGLWLAASFKPPAAARATEQGIAGRVLDDQGIPVAHADVALYVNALSRPVDETVTQTDGTYVLVVPPLGQVGSVRVVYEHAHFYPAEWAPTASELDDLLEHGGLVLDDVVLKRHITASFWVATALFAGMLALIVTERLHNTLAALLAVALMFTVSLAGGALSPSLYILDFEQALEHVDFDVIFLLLGMMIVIGVIEETGIFQWLAYQAYRLSRGKVWLLTIILMAIAAVATALLDNVTTMLLITPITVEIALALGITPLSLLMPALLASNVGGLSTLIGTPVNIMIGSYAELGFNDFLLNLTPGVLLAEAGLVVFVLLWYRKEHRKVGQGISPALLKRLEQNGQIKDPAKLRKAGIVFVGLIGLFVFGEQIHLTPAISAIIGAVAMLVWVHQDIKQMMDVVDWTTLIFFISLFIMVGAIQEVGLISLIASSVGNLVQNNLVAALLVIVWASALLSGAVDNIPLAAAMLPVVAFLTRTMPGAQNNSLYYALAVGADMGGNSTLIASSANLVVAGIVERAGYPLTFRKFLAVGLPATLITVTLGCVWLLIRF